MAETIDPRTFLFMTLPFLFSNDPNLSGDQPGRSSSPGCAGRNEHGMTTGAATLAMHSLTPNLRSEMSMHGRLIDIRLFPRHRHDTRRQPPVAPSLRPRAPCRALPSAPLPTRMYPRTAR